jgi:predicted nucleotidyltransferase
MYGLKDAQLEEIVSFISSRREVERAVLFGSRVLGTWKAASDVDIALFGENVTAGFAAAMKFDIEEDSYLPFFFDFVAYPMITNEALKAHINRKGHVLFERG